MPLLTEKDLFVIQHPPAEGIGMIPLTHGFHAIVDADDYERVMQHQWHVQEGNNGVLYAYAKSPTGSLHRFIMKTAQRYNGILIDHVSRNGLDCRKENLRRSNRH